MRARLTALAAAVLALVALAGCGGGDESTVAADEGSDQVIDISGTDPVGEELAGSVAPLVTCGDWREADDEGQRLATIEDVRSQTGLGESGISGPELTDDEAEEVFDNACEPDYAFGFRLYKLYAHAVAFAPLERELRSEQSDG